MAAKQLNNGHPENLLSNSIVLTVNAWIETSDHKLIFHQKNGGAASGSYHTFGGYVECDLPGLGYPDLKASLDHELQSDEELGLSSHEYDVIDYFGTKEGKPSILSEFGTAAVYALVHTSLSAEELQRRIETIPATESLSKKLFCLSIDDLVYSNNIPFHPQTKQVVDTAIRRYQELMTVPS